MAALCKSNGLFCARFVRARSCVREPARLLCERRRLAQRLVHGRVARQQVEPQHRVAEMTLKQ
jgi:hypothetical protein